MNKLDNQKIYKKLDTCQVAKSIELLPEQVRQVLYEARLVKIPYDYSKVTQVVVNGMGASNLGAEIFRSVFADKVKVPITVTPGYSVPASVDKNTLYLISSYSGNTEEPLSVYKEVKKRGAKIMAIASQGKNKLAQLILKDNIPGYIFNPENNPSAQPRLGLGYGIFGATVLLAKSGLLEIKPKQIDDIIASLELWGHEFMSSVPVEANVAKQIANEIYGKQVVLVGAEFLEGNLKALRNQINENGKNFGCYLTLPELNHYSMESLGNPKSNKKDLVFFFVDSELYHPRIQKRSDLTKQVIEKNKIKVVSHKLSADNKLAQSFEMLQLGTWVSFYLSMLNGVRPSDIPWVDWFKKKLG